MVTGLVGDTDSETAGSAVVRAWMSGESKIAKEWGLVPGFCLDVPSLIPGQM